MKKNGFTLIELLAVIVILAILVMVAIPAVTKYLNTARAGTYVDNAKSAISAVRNDAVIGSDYRTCYDLARINTLLEKKLVNSPFGAKYCDQSKITIEYDKDGNATYKILMYDADGHGWFAEKAENELKDTDVRLQTSKVNKDGKIMIDKNGYSCTTTVANSNGVKTPDDSVCNPGGSGE